MTLSRRNFLAHTAPALAIAASVAAHAPNLVGVEPPEEARAAVIGHTGRGDYGHGLDLIFRGRAGFRLVGLADPDPAGRAAALKRTGAERGYADYREMLERERPRWVSIAPRHADQHLDIGMACLRAGAHCYFEKPFAPSPQETDALRAEAARMKCCVGVAHTMRMAPAVVRLKEALAQGILGELREMRAYGKQDARAGGEDLMVLGSHLFDLMRLFAGDPDSVTARVRTGSRGITRGDRRLVRDNVGWVAGELVQADFGFGGGVRGTFTSDARLRETVGHWGIELLGSKGVARVLCDLEPRVMVRKSTGWGAVGRTDDWRPLEGVAAGGADAAMIPAHEWQEAGREGREAQCSGSNGAWAVEMVGGVYRAALESGRVGFPLVERGHPLGG